MFLEMDSEEKDKFLFFIVTSQWIIFKDEKIRSDTIVILRNTSKRYKDAYKKSSLKSDCLWKRRNGEKVWAQYLC